MAEAYLHVRFNLLYILKGEKRGDWSSICCLLLSISTWVPQLKDNGWGIYYYLLVKWSGVGDKVMKLMSGRKRGDPSTSKRRRGTSNTARTWIEFIKNEEKNVHANKGGYRFLRCLKKTSKSHAVCDCFHSTDHRIKQSAINSFSEPSHLQRVFIYFFTAASNKKENEEKHKSAFDGFSILVVLLRMHLVSSVIFPSTRFFTLPVRFNPRPLRPTHTHLSLFHTGKRGRVTPHQ